MSQYIPEFTVWSLGTSSLCYHNCCVGGGISPEHFGYHLVRYDTIVITTTNTTATTAIHITTSTTMMMTTIITLILIIVVLVVVVVVGGGGGYIPLLWRCFIVRFTWGTNKRRIIKSSCYSRLSVR
jgi:hypothetical protein